MSAEHTPGPWKINNNVGRKGELGIIADAAPCIIAIMGNAKEWPVEAQANARLIAAAPALLEACKVVYDGSLSELLQYCIDHKIAYSECYLEPAYRIVILKAAIAQAEKEG